MISYLKLIKLENLILIAIAQLCIRYGIFQPSGIDITLNGFGISLLIIATLCIAAAGNIIIEIYNQESTLLQGKITEKSANFLFVLFNVIGVFIGFYLSNIIGKPGFVALFIIASGGFYMYASYLKEIIVLKNIIIAILMAMSLIVIGIFDILPAITKQNITSQKVIFSIVFDYALFAFTLTFLREIIKDCLTMDKDHSLEIRTIPIVLGKDRTAKLITLLTIIPLILVIYYAYTYLFASTIAVALVLAFIVAPLLYIVIKSWSSESHKNFKTLSILLKIVMITSTLSLLSYQFILK